MNRYLRTAALLLVVVLLASCGAATTAAPAGHSGHPARSAAPAAAPLRDGERFVNLTMDEPYRPTGPNGGTDDYRCFLIDPRLASRVSLTGAQFQPQNTEVVHHAIFFRLGPEQAANARKLDDKTPGQGWTCFGDEGVGESSWVTHWAPGTNETLLDARYGYDLPPGSRLVMQVHYNLLGVKGEPGTDKSSIRLRVTDRVLRPLETALFAAPVELPCTPQESGPLCDRAAAIKDVGRRFGAEIQQDVGETEQFCGRKKPGPTQYCDQRMEGPAVIHGLAGHMHLLGRSIKVELNPGKPGARTLLDVPEYNFDDQALRVLPAPVDVKKGDVVRVTCTHDAKLRSMLPQLRELPPRYVVWGAGTSDEMCLGIAIVSLT
ncbi:Copper type II ascorbate-dependent monooxygenase, C-terminal domain [Nonomuraea solani]|uniref:Copper type II ascorbate-dependent monooxygenase, C-terminal domain n=1 Tax=Nonomuraea solani TaxID=1144553 RepID=A0A1H6EM96_9ACTN|nr:monooxygenase [Nonomuraea solani]SEG98221.1 Copper type II ascorbate-dependent monooxygenase, C-terminal domain [Nonomuraea solani]